MVITTPEREVLPLYQFMNRIPGGLMLIPLVIGSLLGTFATGFLGLGSFTTALFADSALPLIALLIFATGTQVPLKAGNAIATPAIVALADPRFEPYVEAATAQVAASVLVTAIIAPLLASAVLKREGGLLEEQEIARIDDMELGVKEPQL